MSEFLQNSDKQEQEQQLNPEKQEQLKQIIKQLHAGATVRDLKKGFGELLTDLSAEEIASMEQSLVNEGFPVSSIQDLCEVHVEVFEDSLMKNKDEAQLNGHPVYTYRQENRELEQRLDVLDELFKDLKKSGKKQGTKQSSYYKQDILDKLKDLFVFEKHYQRKENQLFPKLENVGFTGPTSVMWGKHDEIRNVWKALRKAVEADEKPAELRKLFKEVKKKMEKMIFMEEKILLPTSLKKLTPLDWAAIRAEETEIGHSWVSPGSIWDPSIAIRKYAKEHNTDASADASGGGSLPNIADYMKSDQQNANSSAGSSETGIPETTAGQGGIMNSRPIQIPLNEGFLNQEQLDLMLRHLPFDITFVDEHDKVRYYSAADDRVFPRTPSIIGRDVEKCHPPKSVHVVEKIVTAFKNKERDKAEFWLNFHDRVIHIRYFPVFDDAGTYRGVIEVSQDITEIQKLTGEHRLLDWE